MGQAEVLKFLEKNPHRWFTAREIAAVLGVSEQAASRCLRVLRRTNSKILVKKIPKKGTRRGGSLLLLYIYRPDGGSPAVEDMDIRPLEALKSFGKPKLRGQTSGGGDG
jgi:predicted transcriptional regulator